MSDWFDREVDALEKRLERGEISDSEFYAELRELREALKEEAHDNAQQAYRDTMGW